MIYINEKKLKNFSFNSSNFFVVSDFDRTLTTNDSLSSWSVLENPKFMDPNFQIRSLELMKQYYPFELDYSIDPVIKSHYMDKWYQKNMDLLYDYHLTHDILMDCVKNSCLKFRDGAKIFLKKLSDLHVPVIILSAGIGNVISYFLELNNCLFSNIHIISNFIEFERNDMLPFSASMIHTSNKSLNRLPCNLKNELQNKESILLFGDLIEDLNMVEKKDLTRTLSFGFLENDEKNNFSLYQENFDVVLTEHCSFDDVKSIIDQIDKKI